MIQILFRRALGGLLATALATGATLAAVLPASAQSTVPGAPGVADVSVVQGDVVIVRGDSGEQVGAAINTPMLPGDYISTGGNSRAEIQFDGISALRLAGNTQVRLVNLNAGSREVQLASGTAQLAELQGNDQAQIDTPSVSVRADQTGDYRVSVQANGETLVTVRSGSATVFSGNGSQTLNPGSTLVAYGDYNSAQVSYQAPIGFDGFDTFNQRRDQEIVASYNANPYVSPYMSGYTDFANYGQWYNVPGYGESWAPNNQGDNWSPYSNGQWVWEPGYGYTWVGNEQWGYVPYHYGNWYYSTGYNQWMWQPPSYQYQDNASAFSQAWLPAMVAFFLTGGNANAALGAAFDASNPYGYGNIGWVPLAPGEQYVPWYSGFGANAAFPQTALAPVTNVTNIYNVYRNIRYVKVIRVVRVDRFRNGDFRNVTSVPISQVVHHIAFVRGAVPVVPTKAVLGVKRAATTVTLSSRFQKPIFTAKAPAVVHEAAFDRQAQALKTVVATKPRVEAAPVHAEAAPHPVYQAPARNQTFHAPVMVTHPATAPRETTAPERQQRPAPERTFAPAPERTMAPARTMVPRETMAPERQQRPAPERTFAPAPERTMAPERQVTPPQQQRQPMPEQRATVAPRQASTFAPRQAPIQRATEAPPHKHPKATPTPPPA